MTSFRIFHKVFSSVADPGCLSRIPDPDFYPSRIPDPGSRIPDPKTATKDRGEKNLLSYLFYSHKFRKIENSFIFKMLKKKIWASFQRIIELFTPNLLLSSQKYRFGIRDPGSEIRVLDPGSGKNLSRIRVQWSKRHRIPDPDPQRWSFPDGLTFKNLAKTKLQNSVEIFVLFNYCLFRLVHFDGETLWQGKSDSHTITLLRPLADIEVTRSIK
jgi:hypothetical protein